MSIWGTRRTACSGGITSALTATSVTRAAAEGVSGQRKCQPDSASQPSTSRGQEFRERRNREGKTLNCGAGAMTRTSDYRQIGPINRSGRACLTNDRVMKEIEGLCDSQDWKRLFWSAYRRLFWAPRTERSRLAVELQNEAVVKVLGPRPVPVDVLVIAALHQAVRSTASCWRAGSRFESLEPNVRSSTGECGSRTAYASPFQPVPEPARNASDKTRTTE
jgi:hypothetical protein